MESPGVSPGSADPHRRRRRLLSTFYGISDKVEKEKVESGSIDGSDFDAERYVKQQIDHKPLEELVRNNNARVAEVRSLDGELQNLVYENYSKFIVASDIVKQIRSNVEGLDEDLENLRGNIEQISSFAEHINSSLSERRGKIEELTGVRQQMKKLQFLFELPSKMRNAIDDDDLEAGVKYVTLAWGILERYSNVRSFRNLSTETEVTAAKLQAELRQSLSNFAQEQRMLADAADLSQASPADIVESTARTVMNRNSEVGDEDTLTWCVRLLLQLHESESEMRRTFLEFWRFELCALVAALSIPPDDSETLAPAVAQTTTSEYVSPGKGGAGAGSESTDVTASAAAHAQDSPTNDTNEDDDEDEAARDELFQRAKSPVKASEDKPEQRPRSQSASSKGSTESLLVLLCRSGVFLTALSRFVSAFERLFLATKAEDARAAAENARDAVVSVALSWYFQAMQNRFGCFEGSMHSLVRALEQWKASLSGLKCHTSAFETVSNEATSAANAVIKAITVAGLSRYENERRESVDELQRQLESGAYVDMDAVYGELLFGIRGLCAKQRDLMEAQSTYLPESAGGSVSSMAEKVSGSLERFAGDLRERAEQNSPRFALFASKLCRFMESSGVAQVESVLADVLGATDAASRSALGSNKLSALFAAAARELLAQYVSARGGALARQLERYLDAKDWSAIRSDPKEAAAEVVSITRNVIDALLESRQVFPSDHHGMAIQEFLNSDRTFQLADAVVQTRKVSLSAGIDKGIEKLFGGNVVVFGNVCYDADDITSTIVRLVLKAFLESIRVQTLSRRALHQLQCDTEFMRYFFARVVHDGSVVHHLLDECTTSMLDRCLSPDPLAIPEVHRILDGSGPGSSAP